MASLWHILFPRPADVTAPGHVGKSTAEPHCCASSSSNKEHPTAQLPASPAAGSNAPDSQGCCKGSAPTQASCSQDSPAEARNLSTCLSDSQHTGSGAAKGQQEPAPSSQTVGKVLYASQTGTAAFYANQLAKAAASVGLALTVADVAQYEVEQMWKEQCIVLVLPTYEDGAPPSSAK